MKNAILAGLGVVVLGGAGALGLLSGDGETTLDKSEPVAVEELRPTMLSGACPSSVATEAAKCSESYQTDKGCLCLTTQAVGQVDGEMESADAQPAKDRVQLVVCCDHERARVLRLPVGEPLKPECHAVGQPVSDFTMGDMETDYSKMMTAFCAPCTTLVPGCPDCYCSKDGCAKVCPASPSEPVDAPVE